MAGAAHPRVISSRDSQPRQTKPRHRSTGTSRLRNFIKIPAKRGKKATGGRPTAHGGAQSSADTKMKSLATKELTVPWRYRSILTVRSKSLGSRMGLVRATTPLWWFTFRVLKKPSSLPPVMASFMLSPETELEGPMRKTTAGTWMLVGKERW